MDANKAAIAIYSQNAVHVVGVHCVRVNVCQRPQNTTTVDERNGILSIVHACDQGKTTIKTHTVIIVFLYFMLW